MPASEPSVHHASGADLAWSVLADLPDTAVVVYDRDLTIVEAVGEAVARAGLDRRLMVGRPARDVLPAEVWDRYSSYLQRALAGESSSVEADSHDGERILRTEFSPWRGAGGELAGVLAIARDVTDERRRARELHEQWEQSFLSSARGICVIDPATSTIRSVNPAFAAMHGGTVEDFAGRSSGVFLPPEIVPGVRALRDDPDRSELIRTESVHVRLDGTRFPVRAEILAPSRAAATASPGSRT